MLQREIAPVQLRIVRPIRILSAGNHHPVLCEMATHDGNPCGVWLIKPCVVLSRATDRGEFGVLSELAAAQVCVSCGIGVPEFGLTSFDTFDAASVRGGLLGLEPSEEDEIIEIFRANQGKVAFCSRHLQGAVDLSPGHLKRRRWRSTSIPEATRLFVLDVYLRHDDRLVKNSNSLWFDGHVVAIDHGSAFAGLQRAGTSGAALAAHELPHAPNFNEHVAYDAIRAHAASSTWESAIAPFESLDPKRVSTITRTWPKELDRDGQTSQKGLLQRVAHFLAARGSHVRECIMVLRQRSGASAK